MRDVEPAVQLIAETTFACKIALEILRVQMWRPRRPLPEHLDKQIGEDGFAGKAQPLSLVLLRARGETKE